ncbi:MAG: outer membrane protein transport protein, partial [Gammaproteobacteria bacterium]|nr:outer membrane protein transport protein [Gammaproteobacteria bacterium]
YRYSFGVDYILNDRWTLRGGIALDESPIPDEFRTARLPDEDRNWVSFGATWKLRDNFELDFGWAHLFIDDDIPFDDESSTQDRVAGEFEAEADIVGVEIRYQF